MGREDRPRGFKARRGLRGLRGLFRTWTKAL